MGFRINGCGTVDKIKKIRYLGNHYCTICQSNESFYLYEKNKKISVVFIPTVSVNTAYGIYCEKCERGYSITAQQKYDICNGDNSCVNQLFGDREKKQQ